MSCTTFEPQWTSTPKKLNKNLISNFCSPTRPVHMRYSLSKCIPLPIDSSTPNGKKSRKSFAPDIHQLIYPTRLSSAQPMKIWVL